ncbi:hypothetical protein M407DRAFT_154002 [Tulasnella calospora MUT 4182]|uniref:Uncharacterized protein n=1 Tax=Tulasnella calospora MUT 4182 TaxID=1051891 RepID=A0A0C3QFZ8_9AGAM|nr:hypothetical protein M407DRAFT_154002 [Tulasnella calospora MUT 4182]
MQPGSYTPATFGANSFIVLSTCYSNEPDASTGSPIIGKPFDRDKLTGEAGKVIRNCRKRRQSVIFVYTYGYNNFASVKEYACQDSRHHLSAGS